MTAHTGLWRTVACVLFFQDALSGALFLPVLPSLVGQLLGMERDTVGFSTAWVVAVLLASYYVGRSGTLTAAVRLCSSGSSRAPAAIPPSLLTVGVLLVLSTSAYAGCGIVVVLVDHEQQPTTSSLYVLLYFCLFRALTGALAAGHRMSACRCLDHAALLESAPTTTTTAAKLGSRSWQESAGAVGGLVVGCALAGGLFEYSDPSRPTLLLCLAAAAAHAAALPLVLLVAWRNCCSSRSGTVDGGGGYSTVQGTPGGSDAEVELMGRPPWSARDDSFDGGRGDSTAAAAAATPGAGSEERVVDIPGRYLRGCAGDPVEAERRWRLTLEWRAKERIDEVLREPQPHFELIKRHYPHYIHRRARNGCPVWIELPGRIDLPAIRSAGVSPEALQRHYVFVTEYMWGVLEPDFENGQAVTVLDVQGLGMRDLAGEALGFVKQATAIVQDHYVERSNRMFIVNAPSYFSLIWRVIRPMLNERTQAKIGIINTDAKKIAAALLECIAPENLPRQYGGTCPLDLGESEEELDLRTYVASIATAAAAGPGSHAGPPPPPPSGLEALRSNEEEEEEVEVDFRARSEPTARAGGVGPRNNGLPAAAAAGTVTKGRGLAESGVLGGAGAGLEETGGGGLVAAGRPPGAARRVLGSVRGALGWAGGKLAWRRSTVAHLGQENGFQYDSEQHRWVLRDDMAGGSGGKAGAVEGGGASEGGGERAGQTTSTRRERGASVSSEDMTVLAIQAAHHSLVEAGLKLSPVPSESPAVLGSSSGVAAARDDGGLPSRLTYGGKHGTFPGGVAAGEDHHYCYPQPVSSLGVPCPCLRPLGRRASRPDVATVLYASSAAVREALPVWLLAGVEAGGLGASPPRVGLVLAAGALVAAAGRGASGCCCGAQYPGEAGGGGGGGGGAGRRLLYAVWARLASVVVLGAVYLLPRIVPEAVAAAFIPPAVLWLAVAAVVAANHASLEMCTAAAAAAAAAAGEGAASAASSTAGSRHRRPMFVSRTTSSSSHGPSDERTRSTSSASCGSGFVGASRGPWARGSSLATASGSNLFVRDVLGSIAGPLVLALAMWAGQRSPLEPSLWLALCLCGDLWLVTGAREAEPRHATLLGGGEEEDEEEEERRRSRRFAQFV
ncbi:unnamed protein product [Ectocarpus sp. 6 AP-2014]